MHWARHPESLEGEEVTALSIPQMSIKKDRYQLQSGDITLLPGILPVRFRVAFGQQNQSENIGMKSSPHPQNQTGV